MRAWQNHAVRLSGATSDKTTGSRLRATLRGWACLALAAALALAPVPARADARIDALAASLGNDPAQIFSYLRDRVGVELYSGSSRGALGTLASRAGNPLDRAALGVALLRASGYTARYAQATLATSDAQQIVARAFPGVQRALGCHNPGALSNPGNDFQLIGYASKHTWIEYKPSGAAPFTAFDPTLANAAIGAAPASPSATFDDIPGSQKQRVRFRLVAETYSQAGAVFGFPLGSATVLDRSFDAEELIDKPVSIGHLVTRSTPPGLAISASTNTYSPYLVIGDATLDPRDYEVVRGTDYSEVLTNYPLGTTLLTGVTLAIDLIDPADPAHPTTVERTLLDRIGYAKRRTGGTVDFATTPEDGPAIAELDLLTVQVASSAQPLDGFAARRTRMQALQAEASSIASAVAAIPAPESMTPDDVALAARAVSLNRALAIALMELATTSFQGASDVATERNASLFLVKATLASPRVTMARTVLADGTLSLSLDLRRNALSAYPQPGVSFENARHFERARGLTESVLEGTVLGQITGETPVTLATLFDAQRDPSAYVPLTPANVADVDGLALSDDAKARIRDALAANRTVLAPRAPVDVGGTKPLTAWFESDITTGASISTFEDGTHNALVEYAALYYARLNEQGAHNAMAKFVGKINALALVSLAYMSGLLDAIAADAGFRESFVTTKEVIKEVMDNALNGILTYLKWTTAELELKGPYSQAAAMIGGLFEGLESFKLGLELSLGDPPVAGVLIAPPLPPLPAPGAPGATAGVSVSLTPDPRFVYRWNGGELPTVFLATIVNTGPATDTFRLQPQFSGSPFSVPLWPPAVTLAPGATGELSLCFVPGGPLAAPGTSIGFGALVQSVSAPAVQTSTTGNFATPAMTAASMRILPGGAEVAAGGSTQATLTIDSLGNSATTVVLDAALASGLALSGLPPSLALPAGGTISLPLDFTVAGGTPAGTSLGALVRGDFGGLEPATTAYVTTVVSAATQCTVKAGAAANDLTRTALGASLFRLASDMDALAASPGDAIARGAALAELDYLTGVQMTGGDQAYLAATAATLSTLRASLAAAAPGGVPAALASIDAALCGLRSTLAEASQGDFGLWLAPATAYNLPTQSTQVAINVSNARAVPRVFDIAVSGVPAGVTATVVPSSVTVPASYQTNGCCGAPSLTVTFANTDGEARAFDYTITATPRDQPAASRSVQGQLMLRPDLMRVVAVSPLPVYGPAGTPIVVSVRGMNSLNTARTVYAEWSARDRDGVWRKGGNSGGTAVASGDGLFDLPPFTIDTTGLADGPYTIDIVLRDGTACCDAFPGGSGQGAFIVGLPFSATLSVAPQAVPPGDSNVTLTLALSHDSLPTPSIVPIGAFALPAAARSLARRGDYLYACEEDRVTVIDASDPSALVNVGTFATGQLAAGYGSVGCNIDGDTLVLAYSGDTPTSFDTVKIVAFDIGAGHETAPVALNATPADLGRLFGASILFDGTIGYLPTQIFLYNPFSKFIFQQNGNLLRVDFTTPSAPLLAGELFHHVGAGDTYDPVYGGPNLVTGVARSGSHLYLSTSTSTGGAVDVGVGRLAVVDATQLAGNCPGSPNPCITGTIDVPGTRILFGVARQGNTLIAAGDTLGYYDAVRGLTGNLTITAFDLTDPANPVLRSTLVTPLNNARYQNQCMADADAGSATITALDQQFYAVSGFNPATCSWVMAMVDATDPDNLRVIPYDVTDVLTGTLLDGDTLYAMTRTGILTYDYAILTGPAITARVAMAKGTGVTVTPGSFSLAPTSVDTTDSDFDTYTWVQPSASVITWGAQVADMAPGETREVAVAGDVEFTLPSIGHGVLPLGGASVVSDQAMSIAPVAQTAGLGRPASYTITIDNPSAAPITYTLDVAGVDPSWIVHLDTPIVVPAGGSATSMLVLQSSLGDVGVSHPFVVTATAAGFATSARARLDLNGFDRPIGPDTTSAVLGTTVVPAPNPAASGRGGTARVTFATTNIGTADATYHYAPAVVPPGWSVTFETSDAVTHPDSRFDAMARITVPPTAAPGSYDVEVDLWNSFWYQGRFAVSVDVSAAGVQLAIAPGSGTPATTFDVAVTNSGTSSDTFDLTAAGPLGPVVAFDVAAVTLAAGASQTVHASLDATAWLPAGTSSFEVIAQSQADANARARATATVALAAVRGADLTVDPPSVNVGTTPATRDFALRLLNAGNVEDSYRLAIASTTGDVSASLTAANGAQVASIASASLPGAALAQFTLRATLASGLSGSVTVEARSNIDDAVVDSVTVTLSASGAAVLAAAPPTLAFGSQIVGTSSAAKSATITNSGSAPLTIGALAIAGAAASDFAQQSNPGACALGGVLAAGGGSCTLEFVFTPGAVGARSASVTVGDGASNSVAVALEGSGTAGDTCYTGSVPGGSATACFTGGGAACRFERAAFIALEGGPGSPPAGSAPDGFTFPYGLFDFATTGCAGGGTLDFSIVYPAPLPARSVYYKYDSPGGGAPPVWHTIAATIDGRTVRFSLPAGNVVDPGGPAYADAVAPPAAPAAPIPTLGGRALALLVLLLGLLASCTFAVRQGERGSHRSSQAFNASG